MPSSEPAAPNGPPVGSRHGAAVALALALSLAAGIAAPVLAADPSPTAAAAGDPRSAGQGPGLVGDPLFAIGIVVLIGVTALVVTIAWVRLTASHEAPDNR